MLSPIPAIDIIEGKCVRLSKGDYNSKTIYDSSPVDMAKRFEDLGFNRLHLVDLDGAKSQHVVNIHTLQQIVKETSLSIDFGGGIKSEEDIKAVLDSGASLITIGSLAVNDPATVSGWIQQYGAEHIIIGADVKDGYVCINGWRESSKLKLFDFIGSYISQGIIYILCTDISKDGMLGGTSIDLYKQIMKHYPKCELIASGGVSGMSDLIELNDAGIPNVVIGKAIYENTLDLKEVAEIFLNPTNRPRS